MTKPMTDGEVVTELRELSTDYLHAPLIEAALSRALEWLAAIERVRKMHAEVTYPEDGIFCRECQRGYPCPTIRALDGATP